MENTSCLFLSKTLDIYKYVIKTSILLFTCKHGSEVGTVGSQNHFVSIKGDVTYMQ